MIITKNNKLPLYLASVLVLLFVIVFSFLRLFPKTEEIENVTFHLSNSSYGNYKASILVKLNDSIIAKSEDIKTMKDPVLSLKDGLYTIEVSNLEHEFTIKREFKIINNQEKYIYISFTKLSYDEFLPVYKQEYFKRYIKKKKYTPEEKTEIWKQIDQKLTSKSLKLLGYLEENPSFKIKIFDESSMID
ncbi:hypothetical protein [Flavobacterium foetidum]|uniref:hypothetical protein n=1 Tax=Flavobacterium foetidum TaxID=2026681 RepID=UPI001074E597|nr:hypothetical protein [Flavobacterium foetidum]KAF2513872.1 hypothetical protein E0W73_13675 [Flavobacterium foetidum]